jgi:hypothetical protein
MLADVIRTLGQIARLPVARLELDLSCNPDDVMLTYYNLTRPHPKYKIIRHKSIGVALLDLKSYGNASDYHTSMQCTHSPAPRHAKRAQGRGFSVREFDRNTCVDEIHDIHTSLDIRQGRPLDAQYLVKQASYENLPNYRCYGAFDRNGRLHAYCHYGYYGNFAAFDRLIGYRSNEGAMHLLVMQVIAGLIEERRFDFLMYDTFFGAQPGMKSFKSQLGFTPYRVRYCIK